ncbi:MAG: UDP-N-acetylmuramoyl-L-alanyl-D-glutamate--2,6-diaminopimelate ligase [Candidatus Promineifilaceae bacterium]
MADEINQMGKSLHALLASWEAVTVGTQLPRPPHYDGPDLRLTCLTEKSGEVNNGACFVARVRETSDGHPFISKAIDNGAMLIVAQKSPLEAGVTVPPGVVYLQVPDTAAAMAWLAAAWEGFPSRQLVMIGVTGTDGKTTTANILLAMLRAAGIRSGLLSTTRAVIGEQQEPLELHVTTPEAPVVQHHLRRMVEAGMTHCILEATSHGLVQQRVGAIAFDIAVVTNVTHEHLDYHGDFEKYLAAKRLLFEKLERERWPAAGTSAPKQSQERTAILNRDDGSYQSLSSVPAAQQISYAIHANADVMAANIVYAAAETRFTINVSPILQPASQQRIALRSPLAGEFNVYNALAAASAALAAGAPLQAVSQGLQDMEQVSGRMERIDAGQPFQVIVDFAHTPNALANVIRAARRMAEGRIIVVFGSAGKRDVSKRQLMAEIAAAEADLYILTAEDPRTDPLEEILTSMAGAAAAAGGVEGQTFWRVSDRGIAIHFALSLARAEDIVLICGKGHEQSMCFGVVEYPWDDRVAARKALEALAAGEPMADLGLPTFKAG